MNPGRRRFFRRSMSFAAALGCCAAICIARPGAAADDAPAPYRVTFRGMLMLPETAPDADGNAVRLTGLSGITWLGDDRYAAVMDNSDRLVLFRVTLSQVGMPREIADLRVVTLSARHDYEDVAPCPESLMTRIVERRLRQGEDDPGRCLLVSEESTPGLRAVSLDTGELLGVVPIPDQFRAPRPNRALEAVAVDGDGRFIWTANEEALPADGPAASEAAGTVVRLARIPVPEGDGKPQAGAAQFAYAVDAPHAFVRVFAGEPLSGVSALVSLGGGRLLVLERSGSPGLPPFASRIYLVDTSRGIDVSAIERDLAGLREKLLDKLLLWKDSLGSNVEGLCLGPRLADGGMALVGIADNGGLAAPTQLVTFSLESPPPPTDAALIGAAAALVAVALVVGRLTSP
jgi:hypothetical protein